MRVVVPYRPFIPEVHGDLPPVDWPAAIRMLGVSVRQHCRVEIDVLTDAETEVPARALRYALPPLRLQQWLLEIRLAYLRSEAFDQDTVLMSPDTLILGDIAWVFKLHADLALMVRLHPKFAGNWKAILNSAQWWRYAAKDRLIAFYEQAVLLGAGLCEELQVWGGDTEALRLLLEPLAYGPSERAGLKVQMIASKTLFQSINAEQIAQLEEGKTMGLPHAPLLDFKYRRKIYMQRAFDQIFPGALA